jgi:hypothetical protein
MSIKLSSLKADLKRESDGDWEPAGAELPGVRFKVRSGGTASFRIKSDQLKKKHDRKYAGDVPPDIEAREWGSLIAEELLRGWDGIDEPYSPETALAALTDPEHRALRVAVLACAYRLSLPDVQFAEQATKNSESPSATN